MSYVESCCTPQPGKDALLWKEWLFLQWHERNFNSNFKSQDFSHQWKHFTSSSLLHKATKQLCHPKVGRNPPAEFLQRLVCTRWETTSMGVSLTVTECERRADEDSYVSRIPPPPPRPRGAVFVMTRPVRICMMAAITCVYGWLPSASPWFTSTTMGTQ